VNYIIKKSKKHNYQTWTFLHYFFFEWKIQKIVEGEEVMEGATVENERIELRCQGRGECIGKKGS
jgi:ferredoxin